MGLVFQPLLVEIRSSHDSLVGVGVLATLLLDTDPFMYQNTVRLCVYLLYSSLETFMRWIPDWVLY